VILESGLLLRSQRCVIVEKPTMRVVSFESMSIVLQRFLILIRTLQQIGIGERALLLQTSSGNVLWDCVPYLDAAAIQWVCLTESNLIAIPAN
jgi:hypothetical protein